MLTNFKLIKPLSVITLLVIIEYQFYIGTLIASIKY